MPLEPENQQLLVAAQGFLELGMPLDANDEIEKIDLDVRHLPEVLEVRAAVYLALNRWELLQTVARKLAQYDPDEARWTVWWAYATRRADSIPAARQILIEAVSRQPNVAIYHFNLSCYHCQLGDLASSKAHLHRAIELRKDFRLQALEDDDLRPLWDSL